MIGLKQEWFPAQVPPKPSGQFAHIVMLRVTESYPLFQTDGELNTARVSAGVANPAPMTRLTLFKRKQTTPERLVGRELLRRYGFISAESVETSDKRQTDDNGLPLDEYNVRFCQWTPDAIVYGYAIGDTGSERSKVLSDTGFSLTPYDDSHEAFTLNAPYESGTMSQRGDVTSRINEQDHVVPQVIFPSVVTARDLTLPLFKYVVNNVLRTKRYGAQTTRTGRVDNRILAIVLCDGEIFSNLKFTQRLYDALEARAAISAPDPVNPAVAEAVAAELIPALLAEDGVVVNQLLLGAELDAALRAFVDETSSEESMKAMLEAAFASSKQYHDAWLIKTKGKK
ncbi:MAG: type I-D CRISPR-associated protein Cas7/Csc2 [Anaerolineales bacterium]|nr:type I-D CRISPR-associated protein Cas7/Csc2 [Anaerolineales bacterium]